VQGLRSGLVSGAMTERLGARLQSGSRQFESGWCLVKTRWWASIDWPWVRSVRLTCVYDGPDYLMLYWLC
jgi:hypothetical protein